MPTPTILTDLNTAAQVFSGAFLEELTPILETIKQFSTDFSDAFIAEKGMSVPVPLISPDPAGPWDDATNNYERKKATLKDIQVTIDQNPIAGFGITREQMATFRPEWWEGKAKLNAGSIGLAIREYLFGLVTAANFAREEEMKLATFTKKNITKLRALAVKS